jgi:zinc protease
VGADELAIMTVLTEKAKLADVEKLVEGELSKLAQTPVSEAELHKIKTRVRSSFVFGLQTNLSRATRLGEFESYFGDARLLGLELAAYQQVTPAQIQAAVKKYLGPERRQLVEVVPADAPAPAPIASATPAAPSRVTKPAAPTTQAVAPTKTPTPPPAPAATPGGKP